MLCKLFGHRWESWIRYTTVKITPSYPHMKIKVEYIDQRECKRCGKPESKEGFKTAYYNWYSNELTPY